jgi:hypothetical protein
MRFGGKADCKGMVAMDVETGTSVPVVVGCRVRLSARWFDQRRADRGAQQAVATDHGSHEASSPRDEGHGCNGGP